MEDVPHIHGVLISYNRYNYLDLSSLRQVAGRGRTTFVVAARVLGCFALRKSSLFTNWIGDNRWPFPESPFTARRLCSSPPAAFLIVTKRSGVAI